MDHKEDDIFSLFVTGLKDKETLVASFLQNEDKIKIYDADVDTHHIYDKILDYETFVKAYEYKVMNNLFAFLDLDNDSPVNIEYINFEDVVDLNDTQYKYFIIQGCNDDLSKWVNSILALFKEADVVNNSFSFEKIYSFENNDVMNLAIGIKKNYVKKIEVILKLLHLKDNFGVIWLSDYIKKNLKISI
ncbi:MAG: hypothetical protein IJ068_00370 [Bacilli bacterium]|nr:hypothetical protein [Bacilli bacterium]